MDHSDKPVHQRTDEWKNGNFVQTHVSLSFIIATPPYWKHPHSRMHAHTQARPRYCNLERCTSLQTHRVRGLVSYFNSAPLGRQNSVSNIFWLHLGSLE